MRGDSGFIHEGGNRRGFDSFGNPAPTTFGSLGGQTLPPAVTLSERARDEAQVETFEQNEDARAALRDEDDDQLRQLGDRFNA